MKTTSITIWYRRRASGVRTTLRNVCGTGEGPLGYELLSGTCVVQERGFWGTNYSPEHVRYRRRVSGVRTALETCSVQERGLWGTNYSPEHVRYRRWASGVRTTLRNMFGTGDGPLGYELLSGKCVVQERGLWGTNYSPERVRYRRRVSGVRTALKTCSVQERGL